MKNLSGLILFVFALSIGCSSGNGVPNTAGDDATTDGTFTYPIKVITTTHLLRDLVQQVGGTLVEVESLTVDDDAFLFNPRVDHVDRLREANIVVSHGRSTSCLSTPPVPSATDT